MELIIKERFQSYSVASSPLNAYYYTHKIAGLYNELSIKQKAT